MNYYNEFDPKAAAWLRELIRSGHIPAGHVDQRSISEISPDELTNYAQCHFFAGIGGWSFALQLADWPADQPVWTGSCPCQPFSAAGKQLGTADERHLWPVFFKLISECRPPVVFGEQVASAAGLGWLDGVCADLEAAGYAVGAADMCAASAGAPHIRQRLFWVADSNGRNTSTERQQRGGQQRQQPEDGGACGLEHPQQQGLEGQPRDGDHRHQPGRLDPQTQRPAPASSPTGGVEHTQSNGREQRRAESSGRGIVGGRIAWDSFDLLPCTDGKTRRIESGSFPLAHGVPGRVGLLRGYGNAIVPQVAAAFIQAARPNYGRTAVDPTAFATVESPTYPNPKCLPYAFSNRS